MVSDLSKLSAFSGLQSDFKTWEHELWRVTGVNDMEGTLDPDYRLRSVSFAYKDNKLLYFLIEKSVEHSVEAYSHFKKVAKFDGNAAYFHLREAYIFSSQADGALLLQKLNGFVLQSGERLTTFCTRLTEVFQELEDLDGEHAITFTNTHRS